MSNIEKAVSFLQVNPEDCFITANNTVTGKTVGKEKIYISDLPNNDLAAYIKFHLGTIDKPTMIWIELRKMEGSTHRLKDKFGIEVQPDKQTTTPAPANEQVQANNYPDRVVHEAQPYYGSLGAAANQNAIAVETAKVIDLHVNALRLKDAEKAISKLEEELAVEKKEHRLLQIDYRKALTDLSTKDAEKNVELLLAKAQQTGILDSKGFEKLVDLVPGIMEKAVALKNGGVSEAAGALGTANLSETKKQFVTLVSNSLQDNEVLYLGSICHYLDNQPFLNELTQLIQKYANNGS